MTVQKKYLSLRSQLVACVGFIILFLGLLFHFLSDRYSMLKAFKQLFIIIDCLGGCIIVIALIFVYNHHRNNLKETKLPLIIESSLTFAFNFSLQAVIFHLVFTNSLVPVNIGLFYLFAAYFFTFMALILSLTNSLFKKYSVVLLTLVSFVSGGTLTSGVFLTFTGSINAITSSGISVFSLGIISITGLVIIFSFYPKWKVHLLEGEKEEEEGEQKDEEN
ncbi:MAG: hypothetical protein JXA54_15725 [Candidatus Heimdallarchaeota archaeon]|nr:hypothetical protein [Candidatus Heimdallarchaeota archaeon]